MNNTRTNEAFHDAPDSVMVRDVVVARAVENLPPGTALDLGCGIGTHALMLARMDWRVTGVDISEHAIRIANATAEEHGLSARFIAADTTSWEPDQQYDLVYSTYALPGGADSHKVFHTAIKALRPGGTLIAVEWDHSMAEKWGSGPDDLPSPSDLAAMVPGLEIECAESRTINHMLHNGAAREGDDATIAYLRALKPDDYVDPIAATP